MTHIGQELAFSPIGIICRLSGLFKGFILRHLGLGHKQINADTGKQQQHQSKHPLHHLIHTIDSSCYCRPRNISHQGKICLWKVCTENIIFPFASFCINSCSLACFQPGMNLHHTSLYILIIPKFVILCGKVLIRNGQTTILILDHYTAIWVIICQSKNLG